METLCENTWVVVNTFEIFFSMLPCSGPNWNTDVRPLELLDCYLPKDSSSLPRLWYDESLSDNVLFDFSLCFLSSVIYSSSASNWLNINIKKDHCINLSIIGCHWLLSVIHSFRTEWFSFSFRFTLMFAFFEWLYYSLLCL